MPYKERIISLAMAQQYASQQPDGFVNHIRNDAVVGPLR
jgi:hypothetical protein